MVMQHRTTRDTRRLLTSRLPTSSRLRTVPRVMEQDSAKNKRMGVPDRPHAPSDFHTHSPIRPARGGAENGVKGESRRGGERARVAGQLGG